MKILSIGPANPYRGGIAALNERLAIQLQNEGHQVELINYSLQYPGFLFPGKTQYTDTPAPSNLKILRKINSINPLNWIKTGFQLKNKKADLVLVHFWLPFMAPSTGTLCKLIKSNKKTRVIAIVHNLIPHEKRIGDVLFTRYFVNNTDGFISLSTSVFDDLDQFIKKQPKRFTPHPIYDHYGKIISKNEARKKLGLSESGKYLLFFGFIRDYKGLDLMLHAMTDQRIREQNIQLIIAGEFYSNEEKYTKLIDELGLASQLHLFTSFIPDNEVNLYFSATDMITQPYKTATQSGVTQIGYHFEKPMLVTNVGGLPEIIDNQVNGYVVDVDPKSIADAIVEFYSNNREVKMIEAVKETKKRFSWNNLTNAIFEIDTLCS